MYCLTKKDHISKTCQSSLPAGQQGGSQRVKKASPFCKRVIEGDFNITGPFGERTGPIGPPKGRTIWLRQRCSPLGERALHPIENEKNQDPSLLGCYLCESYFGPNLPWKSSLMDWIVTRNLNILRSIFLDVGFHDRLPFVWVNKSWPWLMKLGKIIWWSINYVNGIQVADILLQYKPS